MAKTKSGPTKVKIITKDGKVDIMSELMSFASTQMQQKTERRTGFLGWLGWTFNIHKLKWITRNYVEGVTVTAEQMNTLTASGGFHISGPIGEPTINKPYDGRTYTIKKDGDA